jgi:hypothetical protein
MKKFLLISFSLFVIIIIAYFLYSPIPEINGGIFNKHRNGVWMAHSWFDEYHSNEEISELGKRLKEYDMKYIYLHVGPLNREGGIPLYSEKVPKSFIQRIKYVNPELMVLAWIGGTNKTFGGKVDLGYPKVINEISSVSKKLIHLGFDGIHINIEPLNDGDTNFINLLRSVRNEIGDKKYLSVAAMKWKSFNLPHTWHSKWFWSSGYYKEMGRLVDQMVVMVYDTAIPFKKLYILYVKSQTINVTNVVAGLRNPSTEILIGLPAYDESRLTHRPEVENIENGLYGIIAGLMNKRSNKSSFGGIAIYSYWVMDNDEWKSYLRLWKGSVI